MKRTLVVLAIAGLTLNTTGTAMAGGVNVDVAIGVPAPVYAAPPIAYHPQAYQQPVYHQPAYQTEVHHARTYVAAPVVAMPAYREGHRMREHGDRGHEAASRRYEH